MSSETFRADRSGAVIVEMAIALPLLLILLLGFVDFGYAFYQWNAGNKAVQVGARLARISDPVATDIATVVKTLPTGKSPGDPVAPDTYHFTCSADSSGAALCTYCDENDKCSTSGSSQTAFDLIYDGDATRPGMHAFLPTLAKSEVHIEYVATGLDFWTRPDGPVPTIRVSIVNHPFQFFFLGGLLGFANITMPNMLSTVTGEDLDSSAP
jgi:hypothetical protein